MVNNLFFLVLKFFKKYKMRLKVLLTQKLLVVSSELFFEVVTLCTLLVSAKRPKKEKVSSSMSNVMNDLMRHKKLDELDAKKAEEST